MHNGTINYYDRGSNGRYTQKTGTGNPFNGIDIGGSTDKAVVPFMVNMDEDNDLEMVVGGDTGVLAYYDKSGNSYTEKTGAENPFNGITTTDIGAPAVLDLDEDGSLDLVLADSTGVRHFEHDGSTFVEKTGPANVFSAVSGGHASEIFRYQQGWPP